MADILLNQLINSEVECDVFLTWLSCQVQNERNFEDINKTDCSQSDFISYFLNFLHEEVPCNNTGKTPQTNTPKRIETKQKLQSSEGIIRRRQSLFTVKNVDQKYDLNKSNSVPLNLNKSIENSGNSTDLSLLSTPKGLKGPNDSNVNDSSYMSPVSPLYLKNNILTPKGQSTLVNSCDKPSTICLGNFITSRKSSSSKKKTYRSLLPEDLNEFKTKRITPTSLNNKKINPKFSQTQNSFNFSNTYEEEEDIKNVKSERNFLAEERIKILTRRNSGESLTSTPKTIRSICNIKNETEPELYFVTYNDKLDTIVRIYIYLLNNNWVLNITSELYFIISLLLMKANDVAVKSEVKPDISLREDLGILNDDNAVENCDNYTKQLHNSEIFENMHNVVYFSCKCLEQLVDILKCYDKSTLRLLSDNKRLQKFSPEFAKKISEISESKTERIVEISANDDQTNVCFNIDTDHKENFPTSASFHAFRKQRDLFYEILRIWENNHLLSGWNFQLSLVGKIKSLLNLSTDPVNFVHFARLFKAQLLSTCGNMQNEEGLSENYVAFLPSLPNLDVDKLNRLKSRLVTKQASNGINALPTFPGHQEFYKEFIIQACHHIFNKHLLDTLSSEIIELNNSKFDGIDLDENNEHEIDVSTRQSYVNCIRSVRMLAKFLGFIQSIPYKSDNPNTSENILSMQLSIRQEIFPLIDIKTILIKSIQEEKVILVVPWIIKYLAMLDYVALRLKYYREVHKILFHLYYNFDKVYNGKSFFNKSLIKLSLGWLFELPHFPEDEFFKYSQNNKDELILCSSGKKTQNLSLDNLEIIDQNVLYICCPYLCELKKMLTSNNSNASGMTVKHITPVTALQSSEDVAKKKLQQQLEDAFFNGQPISIRKTVEFVSERVASTCVKHICNNIVPNAKKEALEELKTITGDWRVNRPEADAEIDREKTILQQKSIQLIQKNLQKLKSECDAEVAKIAKDKTCSAIDGLFALDTLKAAQTTCVSITLRMCHERVDQWINSHININIFKKDFDSELHRILLSNGSPKMNKEKPVFLLPPAGSKKEHNESTISAAHLLEKLRDFSVDIADRKGGVTEDVVSNILNETLITLTERYDVNQSITANICTLLIDISLLLVAYHHAIMRNKLILSKLLSIWKLYYGNTDTLFQHIISPRNIMLLAQSPNVKKSWETLAIFMAYFVKENVLGCETFETQCTTIFRNEWDQGTLKHLTNFFSDFVSFYKSYGKDASKFTLLLDFLSQFCVDL